MSKVKEAVTVYWGDRCPDHDPECPTCQAWDEYDNDLHYKVKTLLSGFFWALRETDAEFRAVDTWSERWGYDIKLYQEHICGPDDMPSASDEGLVASVYPLSRENGVLPDPIMVITTKELSEGEV